MPEVNDARVVGQPITFGIVKTALHFSGIAIPILWMAFQFYSNQDTLVKASKGVDTRISNLETQVNKLDRANVEMQGDIKSLNRLAEMQLEFVTQTHGPRK